MKTSSETTPFSKTISLYWWHWDINFGDYASPYLISKLSPLDIHTQGIPFVQAVKESLYWLIKRKTIKLEKLFESLNNKKHFVIGLGSIITASNKNAYIWGAGFQDPKREFLGGRICAVRGNYTAIKLVEFGYDYCSIQCDPGLLLPLLYRPMIKKQYACGIIPHVREFEDVSKLCEKYNHCHIIDLRTDKVEHVTREIIKCKYVLSSSLHGLIVAHAYGIPALFFQYTHKGEGLFKYNDYFSSVQIKEYFPEIFSEETNLSLKSIENRFRINGSICLPNRDVLEMQRQLINAAPFPLYEKFYGDSLEKEIHDEFVYLKKLKEVCVKTIQ